MATASPSDPIALLRQIEQRAQGSATRVPRRGEPENLWPGIGFRVGGQRLVAPMGDVGEVLNVPRIARVPGSKDWVVGVANLRGSLLTIVDLQGFLRGWVAETTRDSRVLVVKRGEILAGLLVHEVFGLKHFLSKQRIQGVRSANDWLRPYLSGMFQAEEYEWGILDVRVLVEAPAFMQVAA